MTYIEKKVLPGDPETDPELYEALYRSNPPQSEEIEEESGTLNRRVKVTHWPPVMREPGKP